MARSGSGATPGPAGRGAAAETAACALLQRHGLRVLARNVRCRGGEIDIVARDAQVIVFVEVRLRASPEEAARSIDAAKLSKIRRAAQFYLLRYGDRWPACRFDVVLACAGRLHWLRSAFTMDEE